jgi:hypothetical protein
MKRDGGKPFNTHLHAHLERGQKPDVRLVQPLEDALLPALDPQLIILEHPGHRLGLRDPPALDAAEGDLFCVFQNIEKIVSSSLFTQILEKKRKRKITKARTSTSTRGSSSR